MIDDSPEKPPQPVVPPVKRFETVEEILARLPPVDPDGITWSEDEELDEEEEEEEEEVEEPKPVPEEAVRRLLEEHIEGVNGNMTEGGAGVNASHALNVPLQDTFGGSDSKCPADCSFREWHQTLSKKSYEGELLHILPYVIID